MERNSLANKRKKLILKRKGRFLISVFIFTTIVVTGGSLIAKKYSEKRHAIALAEAHKTAKAEDEIANSDAEKAAKKEEEKAAKEEAAKKEEEKSKILLVNKKNPIVKDYKPADLVAPNIPFASVANPMVENVTKDVAVELENMFEDAKKDGITLLGVSAYRSYEYQVQVFNDSIRAYGLEHSKKYVAQPGQSEHQTGLSIDILSNEYSSLDEGFENTKAFDWLMKNMRNYGFILRYPKGKEDITGYNYEAWHIRYVGVDAAREIAEKNITLEEYLERD